MIAKSAVKAFMNRELRDLSVIKNWEETKVDRFIEQSLQFTPTNPFNTNPYKHQKKCFVLAVRNTNSLFFLDMGLGKTQLMLDVFAYLKSLRSAKVKRVLVLVPTVTVMYVWKNETEKHQPQFDCRCLDGPKKNKFNILTNLGDIVVATYSGWSHMVSTSKGNKLLLDPEKLSELASKFQMIVYDESTALKNHATLNFQIAKAVTHYIIYRYGLTGTPFGRNLQDLWSQFYAIDKGETLGSTLGIFRAGFFSTNKNHWGGYDHTFKKGKMTALRKMINHKSIHYASKECMDLPKQIFNKCPVDMPPEATAYYNKLITDLREAHGNYVEAKNTFVRMRQLASGLLSGSVDDETLLIKLKLNPKLDELLTLREQIPSDKKIVIFNEFIASGEVIAEALTKQKVGYARIYSGTKDKATELHRFDKQKSCQVLVANSQSAALGLNLQVANYVIFYESPVSPIIRAQAEKRCHRGGQKEDSVIYYDIYVRGSIEEKILTYISQGKNLLQELLQGNVELQEKENHARI